MTNEQIDLIRERARQLIASFPPITDDMTLLEINIILHELEPYPEVIMTLWLVK